jgi:hypothetical protein
LSACEKAGFAKPTADDGLPARMDMDVFDANGFLAAAPKLGQVWAC